MNPGYASNSKSQIHWDAIPRLVDSRLGDLSCPTTWPRCFDPWNLGVKYNCTVLPQCFGCFVCFRFFEMSASHCDFQIFSVLSLLLIYCIVHMWPAICNAACLCHDIMHKVTLPSCIKKQSNRCLFLRQWWCQTMATVSVSFIKTYVCLRQICGWNLCLWPSLTWSRLDWRDQFLCLWLRKGSSPCEENGPVLSFLD